MVERAFWASKLFLQSAGINKLRRRSLAGLIPPAVGGTPAEGPTALRYGRGHSDKRLAGREKGDGGEFARPHRVLART
jgi:hypothetical protein